MHILVTGAAGFVGPYVVEELEMAGHKVSVTIREGEKTSLENERHIFDVTQLDQCRAVIRETKPDAIIHLAGESSVARSWCDPAKTIFVNSVGTAMLAQAVLHEAPHCRFLSIGSSEEYGLTAVQEELLTEAHPCQPQNPYGISKLAAGQTVMSLESRGLRGVHVRSFNHFGPGQPLGFVVSDFASQIANIEQGMTEPLLRVGNLSAERDFVSVHDVVRAYRLIIENSNTTGVYNIASGKARTVESLLEVLLSLSTVSIRVVVDRKAFRPIDVPRFAGSCEKLAAATGWMPCENISFHLAETLDWWRNKILAMDTRRSKQL